MAVNKDIKVAIIHDWLTNFGGAERVVKAFCEIFPEAPIYTSVYDRENMKNHFPPEKVNPSFMQKIPFSERYYTKLLSLMPRAFESFDLSEYDIVVSSSSSCAKGVITGPETMHISYVHTPMRYAWDLYFDYYQEAGFITKFFMKKIIPKIRMWDVLNTRRIDYLIANSSYVQNRIKKYYRREAEVIHPPVNTEYFVPSGEPEEDFYLAVSRLVSYKKIDLVVQAFNELDKKLVVIGDGSERPKLEKMAGDNIEFLGRVSDEKLKDYFQKCKALVFAAKEDFGIIPLEAQACGRPVIAYGEGGALETVDNLETGVLFPEQSVASLKNSISKFEELDFSKNKIRKHAEDFSRQRFINQIEEYVFSRYEELKKERKKDLFKNNVDFI